MTLKKEFQDRGKGRNQLSLKSSPLELGRLLTLCVTISVAVPAPSSKNLELGPQRRETTKKVWDCWNEF